MQCYSHVHYANEVIYMDWSLLVLAVIAVWALCAMIGARERRALRRARRIALPDERRDRTEETK